MTVRVFRWKAIGPLVLVLAGVWILIYVLLDPTVKRSVERFGTEIVGARVDLDAADVRLGEGVVYLRALAVTNPDRPMTNLFEAEEIVANFRVQPLLEKKVIIDTVAVRGLRFGTPRSESGAIDQPSRTSQELRREVSAWRERMRPPPLSLEGLGRVVDVGAISAESLSTLRTARGVLQRADSARRNWGARIDALNPRPTIDSARALAARLGTANVRTLGLAGARDAVSSARTTLAGLTALDNGLRELERGVAGEVAAVGSGLEAMVQARLEDLAYARRLLKLPSLDAPSIGPALFGEAAAEQVAPYLYWLGVTERYMPPGVRSRLRQGKDRARRAGTDVIYPRREQLPRFLLALAEASVAIGGTGAGAGNYELLLTDVTTAPTLVGRPMTFHLARTEGQVGPRTIRAGGILNHVTLPVRDSADALVDGVSLPSLRLAPVGATVHLGLGTTSLRLERLGDSLDARWRWHARDVRWERLGSGADTSGARAAPANVAGLAREAGRRAEDVAWRALSRLAEVEIEARLTGSVRRPRLSVGSNVAGALATALRDELGAEVRRAEQELRARVDALVETEVDRARASADALTLQVADRIAERRRDVERVKSDLETQIRRLTGGLPIGE